MRMHRGFTLIELLVTMAVLAILSAIAWPNYLNYVNQSKAATAQQAIAAAMGALEQQYLDTRSYPASDTIADTHNYFTYVYTPTGNPLGQSYTITASGNGVLGQYYVAANSNDLRCACLACSGNPLSGFSAMLNSCPAGSTPW